MQRQDDFTAEAVAYAAPDVMVDGVRCFADPEVANDSARDIAMLSFRVGMADEHLPIRGLTHMVEHLTLGGLLGTDLQINGQVDATTTSFMINGTPEQIVWFVQYVCTALATPDLSRIALEAQVLRAESEGLGQSPLFFPLELRFGARSYGNRSVKEIFFQNPDPAWVTYWLSKYFVAENAVFWCSGALPDGLAFNLASGSIPPLPPEPWIELPQPGFVQRGTNGVAIDVMSHITWPAALARIAIREHLFQRLRNELGLSYEVNLLSEPIGASWTHAMIYADSSVELQQDLHGHFVAELHELALTGFSRETLNKLMSMYTTSIQELAGTDPQGRAQSALTGRPYHDPGGGLEVLAAISTEELRDEVVTMLNHAIWLFPQNITLNDARILPIDGWSQRQAVGVPTKISNPDDPLDPTSLLVDEHCITLFVDEQREFPITVVFLECALNYQHADGDRTLVNGDGSTIQLHRNHWADFDQLVNWLDQRIPHDVAARERGQPQSQSQPQHHPYGDPLITQSHNWGR